MAVVTTTITPALRYFPYSGLPDSYKERSPFPRGELTFVADTEAIALTGAGDNQNLRIRCTLPQGFAYVLADLAFDVFAAVAGDANNFPVNATAFIVDSSVAGQDRTYRTDFSMISESSSLTPGNLIKTYRPVNQGGKVIRCAPGQTGEMRLDAFNLTANDGAYTLHTFFARFLQYDIEQAHHYQVNSPVPTRTV